MEYFIQNSQNKGILECENKETNRAIEKYIYLSNPKEKDIHEKIKGNSDKENRKYIYMTKKKI